MERLPMEDDEAEDREFLHGFDRIEQRIAQRGEEARRVKYAKIGAVVIGVALGVGLIAALGAGARRADAVPYQCRAKDGGSYNLTFFVIGDWGRLGNGNQLLTAKMMADVAGCMPPDVIISTGDNFYKHGLTSAEDPQFFESFVNVYSQDTIKNVPWFAVLGNHDYNDGINPLKNSNCAAFDLGACPKGCCYSPMWEFSSARNDARWHLSNGSWAVPGLPRGLVDIIMTDTNPFIKRYKKEDWATNAGGLNSQNDTVVRQQLEGLLAASGATWRFVVGHHPVASFGEHCDYGAEGDCTEMAWMAPTLKASNVAVYFAGHDHDMQLIKERPAAVAGMEGVDPWPVYVVSGGGSNVRGNEQASYRESGRYQSPFFMDDQGFVAVRVNETHAVLDVYTSNHQLPATTEVMTARAAAPPAVGSGALPGAGGTHLGRGGRRRRRAMAAAGGGRRRLGPR